MRQNPPAWIAHITLTPQWRLTVTPDRLWIALGLLSVVLLMGLYVAVLHQAVERGQRLRAELAGPAQRVAHQNASAARIDKLSLQNVVQHAPSPAPAR